MENNRKRPLHLIANAKSGRGGGSSLAETAQKIAGELNFEIKLHLIEKPDQLQSFAATAVAEAEKDGGVIAAAGGDGTVRSVAQFIVGKKIPFAVIPCGTFNLFARTHNIPEDAEAALRLAMTGAQTPVRIAKINDEVFVLNASLGLYAKVINDRKARTSRWGRHRIVALLSTAISLMQGHKSLDVELTFDGEKRTIKTPMIFIGNNSLQLKNLALQIAECMKKDRLAAVTMKKVTHWEMLRILFRGVAHSLEKEERLETFCVESLDIRTRHYSENHKHRVALDGEMFHLSSPLKVRALPDALFLIKPQNL